MAAELVKPTMEACHIEEYEVLPETVHGDELELVEYQHPFLDRTGLVILGDHVTLEGGYRLRPYRARPRCRGL